MKISSLKILFFTSLILLLSAAIYSIAKNNNPISTDSEQIFSVNIPKLKHASQVIEIVNSPADLTIKAGGSMHIPVRITNTGEQRWRTDQGSTLKEGNFVRLSYHWLDQNKVPLPLEGARTPFLTDVASGQSVNLDANIVAPNVPGHYILSLSMVQEHVLWFEQIGGKTLEIPVAVN